MIYAIQNGLRQAQTPIQIVDQFSPVITTQSIAEIGSPFDVTFEFYQPQIITLFLDSITGTVLGTTTSTGPGKFTVTFQFYPEAGLGSHNIVAQGSDASQPPAPPVPIIGGHPPA